jgi:hypothetical protein
MSAKLSAVKTEANYGILMRFVKRHLRESKNSSTDAVATASLTGLPSEIVRLGSFFLMIFSCFAESTNLKLEGKLTSVLNL